jgi:Flp pilus assembly protein TadD
LETDVTVDGTLNPNLAVAYLAWSRCHLCIANFDEAEERLGIAAKLDPLSPLVLRQLAAQSLCRGRYQEALRFGQETLRMNADDWQAPYFIGMAQHAIGESAQALSTLRTAFETRPSHPSVVAALAFVMTETGDVEGGRRLIDHLRDRAMQA